jgi:hypothetical protein
VHMLGNSVSRGLALVAALALWLSAGCANTVSQEKATGPDGKPKGAKKLTFENGEAEGRGVVTYPGGDRVDWKSVELTERGTLDLRLKWQPARPGLDLAFDVYDEYGTRVGGAKPRKNSRRTSKKATLPNLKGTYLVMIYAPERGDAGKYTLTATFQPELGIDPSKLQIPDPPRLPAVPEPKAPCDDTNYKKRPDDCIDFCPSTGDPKWKGCSGICPATPDVNIPACQKTMPCPNPSAPDRRVADCRQYFPPCDAARKDPANPNCDNFKREPIRAKIINVQTTGSGEAIITVNRGSEKGVAEGWKGQVVSGSGSAVNGGAFTVIRVTKREAVGKVRLTTDQLSQNPNVTLSEP